MQTQFFLWFVWPGIPKQCKIYCGAVVFQRKCEREFDKPQHTIMEEHKSNRKLLDVRAKCNGLRSGALENNAETPICMQYFV